MAQRGLLRFVEILDYGAGRGDKGIISVADAETFESDSAEMFKQALPGLVRVEVPQWPFGDGCRGQVLDIAGELSCFSLEEFAASVGQQTLSGRQSQQLVEEVFFRYVLNEEMAGRNIDPADSGGVTAAETDGTEEIVLFCVQQDFICESAGRDKAGNIAFDNTNCGFGVLDLVADGDLVAGLQHFFQVAVNSVVGNAGQRNGIGAFVPAGQRQAADARAGFRILVKGLVEVAHPEKQYAVGVFLLVMVELLHRGR